MTHTDMLKAQLAEVAYRRLARDLKKAALAAKRAAFDAEHATLIDETKTADAALAQSEEEARALIVAIYQTTGEKKPAEGAGVQVRTKLQYDDAAALAWAKQTGMALVPESVDRKALEKIAKATPLPFVTVLEEPTATLATDLSAYLASDANPASVEAPF